MDLQIDSSCMRALLQHANGEQGKPCCCNKTTEWSWANAPVSVVLTIVSHIYSGPRPTPISRGTRGMEWAAAWILAPTACCCCFSSCCVAQTSIVPWVGPRYWRPTVLYAQLADLTRPRALAPNVIRDGRQRQEEGHYLMHGLR